jgi:hypothetical protein
MPTEKLGQKGKIFEGTQILTLVGARAIGGVAQSITHNPVTLDSTTHADDLLGLTDQLITLDSQAANVVFAGPASGAAAAPTMRALVAADIPANNLVTLIFGDGSDGVVTISADTVLTRPMYYQTLTVNSTKKLITNGYSVFVRGTLTNNGGIYEVDPATIDGSAGGAGTDAVGGAGGNSALPSIAVPLPDADGCDGADGGFNSIGNDGYNSHSIISIYEDGLNGIIGAAGGAGDSAGGVGGAAGEIETYCGIEHSTHYRSIVVAVSIAQQLYSNINPVYFSASAYNGGAAGGGGGSGAGGGGGGGCGWCAISLRIFANVISGTGIFCCNGGDGGDGGDGYGAGAGKAGGGGGGAGGNGGIILLGYGSKAGTWTTDVTGGAGGDGGAAGNGGEAGADGPDGQDGVVIELT